MEDINNKRTAYDNYLLSKIKVAEKHGIEVTEDEVHESSLPHQRKITPWLLKLGAGLLGADCGMGKTHMGIDVFRLLHQRFSGKYLVVTELGAKETWIDNDPTVGDGARMGIGIEYVTNTAEAFKSDCFIVVTNYERVRLGEFNFAAFEGVWLDEGNYIKNMASETTDVLAKELAKVKWKFIATATPCPNEILELINYAHVLGIADRGQILTRFFQRNSTKAGELTLHPQHEEDFWLWVYSWAVFITDPADLGFDNTGYELPELIVNWHEVPMGRAIDGGITREGQKKIFADSSTSLPEASRVKRDSLLYRIAYAAKLMLEYEDKDNIKDLQEHYLLWHHLEAERLALKEVFKEHIGYGQIYGKQDWAEREKNVVDFSKGALQILGTKPDLSGVGCNFQKHCHHAIAIGINDSWDEFYQAIIKRLHRYGQKETVILDVLYVREEQERVNNIKRKWAEHNILRDNMRALVREHGLGNEKFLEQKRRSLMERRQVWAGDNYTLINNDCVYEWMGMADNTIDLINTSFPFGNHYEYTDKYNDFGHNATNTEFFTQMDFLIPELLRTLKPGRICAVHLKNRIHYGSVTGKGFSIFHRFTHHVCDAMEKHGFETLGFHYIPTDVVQENNQTYRLTFGEMQKDSTKMGSGIPEEIWIFRKPPTSTENAYADEPVTHNICICPSCDHREALGEFKKSAVGKTKDEQDEVEIHSAYRCPKCKAKIKEEDLIKDYSEEYTLARWQIDADAMWGSSGNRLITPEEIKAWGLDKIRKWWNVYNPDTVYDYEKHVELLQSLDASRKLSRTFTTLPLRSNTPFIWNDVNRMHGLNMQQHRRKQQNHICPQPTDEANRVIELYSNEGDLVADPFGGLGTTGVCALKKGRKAIITELNATYAINASYYLQEAEKKNTIPTLFDLIGLQNAS